MTGTIPETEIRDSSNSSRIRAAIRGITSPSISLRNSSRSTTITSLRPDTSNSRIPGRIQTHSSVRSTRSEEHTSELQSLIRISYAVFCLKKKNKKLTQYLHRQNTKKKKQKTSTQN